MKITKDIVSFILDHPADDGWTLQGLGMLRLYLTPTLRLHVWDSRYAVEGVSTMHNHSWHFSLYVVAGEIQN